MVISVPCYGIHTDPELGAKWLVQKSGVYNAMGLGPEHCPFKIESHHIKCPHSIDMKETAPPDKFIHQMDKYIAGKESLLKYMLPVWTPEPSKYVMIEVTNTKSVFAITKLLSLTSMTPSMTGHIMEVKKNWTSFLRHSNGSNISRSLLSGVCRDNLWAVTQLIDSSASSRGRFFFMGAGNRLPNNGITDHVGVSDDFVDFLMQPDAFSNLRKYGALKIKEYLLAN